MTLSSAPQQSEGFWELTVKEQRERLQQENLDALAWVFDLVHESSSEGFCLFDTKNILACYPNQLIDWQIRLPEDFWNGKIVIVDMWALRKWNIKVIAWNSENIPRINHPVLLSPWVIEYYEGENWKKYTQTVLRDGWQSNSSSWVKWLADANERTTTAGRNFSWKLWDDLEMENAEESPFLMKDAEWNYFLVTHDINYKSALIASMQNYLQKKYLTSDNPNFETVKRAFEFKFKWVKYEELWDILKWIIENDNFEEYLWQEGNIDWIDSRLVSLNDEQGKFYVFHDTVNNTIEYRAIRRITWFPEWLTPVGKIPLRLFLESQNQDPSFKKLENIWKYGAWEAKLVPTIRDIKEKVSLVHNILYVQKSKIHYSYIEDVSKFDPKDIVNCMNKCFMIGEQSYRILKNITPKWDNSKVLFLCEKEIRDGMWRVWSCWEVIIEIDLSS